MGDSYFESKTPFLLCTIHLPWLNNSNPLLSSTETHTLTTAMYLAIVALVAEIRTESWNQLLVKEGYVP